MDIPIIGTGAISAAGPTVEQSRQAIASGADTLAPLSLFDSGLEQAPPCGQIDKPPAVNNAPNRTAQLAAAACDEAIAEIGRLDAVRTGLVFATTVGGITRSEQFYRAFKDDPSIIDTAARELAAHEPTAISGWLAARYRVSGFHTLSTACSTGLHAIGMAARLIETGRYDCCIAAGADALSLLTVRGFASLMLLDFQGCKPFDRRRAGISLGEGAGAMALASPRFASQCGAEPLGRITGWGASADAYHMTAPHPEGAGAAAAIRSALAQAGCAPEHIDCISTHGTATPDNDLSEIAAIRKVFGETPPFGSMKRTLGHTLAASGALEAVFLTEALRHGELFATGGFAEIDDAIGVAPARRSPAKLRTGLKNSFGFGGNNAAVVIARA
jgi:3-oxoacyl-[acyl-carrier-protein] synthase-1